MKCFVTKLNGVVQSNTLLKLGEMRIKVNKVDAPTSSTQAITLTFSKDAVVDIVGDGYFTDASLNSNNGKSVSFTVNEEKTIYVSNGDFEVSILDKYSLTYIKYGSSMYITDIADLKYSLGLIRLFSSKLTGGDLSSISNLNNLITLYAQNSAITGDLDSIKSLTKLENLWVQNSAITGDLNSIKNMLNLSELYCKSTSIKGDFSSLGGMTKLNMLFGNKNIKGNINSLKSNLLKQIFCGNISGDLARVSDKLVFISCSGGSATWSSRTASSMVFGIEGSPSIDNIDKMLQDFANCQVDSSVTDSWTKIISATGTRTSASDAAVQTLQQKGYTVSITPA